MTVYNKIKWILGILIVFVLIVITNLVDRNNFVRVRDSVVTIYEDRLVVKGLIFDMASTMHQKEVAAIVTDSSFFKTKNSTLNTAFNDHIQAYETTKLTTKEDKEFNSLKANFTQLQAAEKAYVNSGFQTNNKVLSSISSIKSNLQSLSKIQLQEGGRQMAISQKAIDTVELFTQMEIYLLVFLALVVQIIILYNPKKEGK
ncbi:chemotaxis protein [Seonamhaeicola algicola]|uniref:Chemotaxis protein n=1 Tax=Seonamhaeicola algicola TaxID=1719036 RepID=A0A5C7AEE7_9FLAO|nr:MCP four helix bundle domain-containing protein [Seonamhaeicola algicola]TXE07106.1 chemotaxis protein [Seonamhaeicola algicola]